MQEISKMHNKKRKNVITLNTTRTRKIICISTRNIKYYVAKVMNYNLFFQPTKNLLQRKMRMIKFLIFKSIHVLN